MSYELSREAIEAIGGQPSPVVKPVPSAQNVIHRQEWVLQRARVMRTGLQLVMSEIDEIGIALKHGWMAPDEAYQHLHNLEQLPCGVVGVLLGSAAE
jgi:hypothetical protein